MVREYTAADLPEMIRIWNEVVEDGVAFPQEELLDAESGAAFFAAQTCSAVAEEEGTGRILGSTSSTPTTSAAAVTWATPATP